MPMLSDILNNPKCGTHKCPTCGDLLIHQTNRRSNESSSGYGQYVQDRYPRNFNFMDVDGIVHKRATGILRLIEHKQLGRPLKRSQREVLPLLARMVDDYVTRGVLPTQSGVFLVRELEEGYGGKCEITRFGEAGEKGKRLFSFEERMPFETGERIKDEWWKELQ